MGVRRRRLALIRVTNSSHDLESGQPIPKDTLSKNVMFTLAADVLIERPHRYGKQLASHLGRKAGVSEMDGGWMLSLRGGEAEIVCHEHVLELRARANDHETVTLIADVLERHLRKFAAKQSLVIDWRGN